MPSYIQEYIHIQVAGFDWDQGNRAKCRKHGLSQAEIESVFRDIVQVAPDPAHSQVEPRQLAIGRTPAGRPAFVVFTLRARDGALFIRPLSARYMHDKEFARYGRQESS